MIGVQINGIEGLLAGFKGYKKESGSAIKRAVSQTIKAMVKTSQQRLRSGLQQKPKHRRTSFLLASVKRMKKYEKDILEGVFGSDMEYAPYIEFGTGDLVEIPEGAEEIAALYKGKGIRKVNIKAVSFLNYSAVIHAKTFMEKLINELNKIAK
jgi:hypothetical protein